MKKIRENRSNCSADAWRPSSRVLSKDELIELERKTNEGMKQLQKMFPGARVVG